MKKFLFRTFFLLACFALFVTFNKVRFRYNWSEAAKRTVMTPFTGTLWAKGFSEAQFAKVQIGMSDAELSKLLGPPLKKWCGEDGCDWLYSWQDTQTADYDRRWISVGKVGLVKAVWHEFVID